MSRQVTSILLLVGLITGANLLLAASVRGASAESLQLERDVELDTLLTQRARYALERVALVDGQSRPRHVNASLNIATGVITVRLDRSFLPEDYGPSFEDQRSNINNGLIYEAEKFAPVSAVEYLYDGKDIYHYFPEVKAADDAARLEGERRRQAAERSGLAVVAAGHGYFMSYRTNTWVTSRDEHNGVSEGLLTPLYAGELRALVEASSGTAVTRVRVQEPGTTHPESGFEWWTMAARYAIAQQYPMETGIWNTYAGSTLWDREEREDINSRPKLANHVGADVVIHLHSNGEDSGVVRGSRVIVQPGRAVDAALGRSVLCSMKELIQSRAGYETFVVAPAPHVDNKGENREAHMPSIIVETAFHTNPADAAALLDPEFRAASMKGVEKGYRLFREGKDCKPLKGEAIEDVSMSQGASREIEVPFEGYPQYPLRIVTRNVGCPPGWVCRGSEITVEAPQPTPLKIALSCNNGGSAPLFWETSLVDDDGVKSVPVRHRQQCIRRP